jgi:hypothetical protein
MTKKQLIDFIQQIPVQDDALVNVSFNGEDIETVDGISFSTPDDDIVDMFCIDFTLKDFSNTCRKCGSPLTIGELCMDETCPFSDKQQ